MIRTKKPKKPKSKKYYYYKRSQKLVWSDSHDFRHVFKEVTYEQAVKLCKRMGKEIKGEG